MRAIAPRIGWPEHTLAEQQTEYLPITVCAVRTENGIGVVSRWTFTEEERQAIAAGEDLYVMLLTFGKPMQPISPLVGKPAWARE